MAIDETLKTEFRELRKRWKTFLSGFALTFEKQDATRGEILDVMVFGEYAHHNEKLARLQSWLSHDLNRHLVKSQFEIMLHELIRIIGLMKAVNEKVLSGCA